MGVFPLVFVLMHSKKDLSLHTDNFAFSEQRPPFPAWVPKRFWRPCGKNWTMRPLTARGPSVHANLNQNVMICRQRCRKRGQTGGCSPCPFLRGAKGAISVLLRSISSYILVSEITCKSLFTISIRQSDSTSIKYNSVCSSTMSQYMFLGITHQCALAPPPRRPTALLTSLFADEHSLEMLQKELWL